MRTVSLKLQPSAEQFAALDSLASSFADACSAIVPLVVEHRCWNRVALHHLAYYQIRALAPSLGSQMVCQAVHRVADAYRALKANKGIDKDKPVPAVKFSQSSVSFDKRTYSIRDATVSLFTLAGRARVPFVAGKHQLNLLASGASKEARLLKRAGTWYFNLCVEIPEPTPRGGGRFGVDVGENNLAATSSGKVFGGGELRHYRDKHLASRSRLQANGSRAAKRKLKAISGREQRHMRHINHETSKAIVAEAMRAGAGEVRLEDLTHIRKRIKAGRRVRARLHRWAFRQLQDFVAYKAIGAGLAVVYVNPAYTSQTCSTRGELGTRAKHSFVCLCGTRLHADVNASRNIAEFAKPTGSARGACNSPFKFAHLVRPGAVESHVL